MLLKFKQRVALAVELYTISVAKTKSLISFAVTAKLICAFVFAYAKSRFSHNEAHIVYFYLVILSRSFSEIKETIRDGP